jgi:hypothetical protein
VQSYRILSAGNSADRVQEVMMAFVVQDYGEQCRAVIEAADTPCLLGPGEPNAQVADQLNSLQVGDLFERPIVDPDLARCCLSALWLLHNFLDESHTLCQSIETSEGSYWHAIMHRREPDYSNSKYWFRRVGDHPLYKSLGPAARMAAVGRDKMAIFEHDWDPYAFVDLCEWSSRGNVDEMMCRLVAQEEWKLLFDYCYRKAIGETD